VAGSQLWMSAKRTGDVTGISTGKGYWRNATRYGGWKKDWVKLQERKLKVVRVKARDLRLSKEAG